MKMKKLIVVILSLSFIFSFGCSDRGTNGIDNPSTIQSGILGVHTGAHVFTKELIFQVGNEFYQMPITAYLPQTSWPNSSGGTIAPIPVLVLLPPQDGDEFYYFNHGLKELADELITNEVIEPMAIVCLAQPQQFGGFFFAGNSPGAGYYDSLFQSSLLDYIYNQFLVMGINDPGQRGIGGIGMGGYGAFRAAILNPDHYTSLSVTDGPYDFDGPNGTSGLMPLFDNALAEQGILGGDLEDFQSKKEWKLSRLLISGALSFSPHVTGVRYDLDYQINPPKELIILVSKDTLPSMTNLNYSLVNTRTLAEGSIDFDVHLPFNSDGIMTQEIWDLWLDHNLENLASPGVLSNVDLWMASTQTAYFANYHEQTMSWLSTLQSEYDVEYVPYTGYNGVPSNKDEFLFELLKDMLIFHDKNFKSNQ